ncbi:putative phage-type endonuclease [Arabidopsis suecica]|uniref:Putative phage-type endonuclease n=2 Tax=Arabidopsis suecica TaxID=45249 RepID=A0A8T2BS39_ARASU|nr:putative phage-type endonuclease [Arabidopsis suecica]
MMMRLVQVSSTESISSISASSARNGGVLYPKCGSVCGLCRVLKPNKVAYNSMILSAMRTCSISGFHTHLPKSGGSVSSRKRFSSTALSVITQTTSPFAHPRSSVIVSSLLSPSDIPQKSEEWFALRKDKLTTSTFSTALGFWKGNRRAELWHEKVYDSDSRVVEESARFAMNWGVQMESAAIDRYKRIMGCEVGTMGFAIHSNEQFHWLGASPDGILDCFGILEVKCPYNKGKTETVLPWKKVPYYYMPQLQGQMEIMDREWVNLYCWTRNGSTVFRVMRDRSYWRIIHDVLREFWWESVIPAREALLLGKEDEEVKKYEPTSTHKRTKLAIAKSINLAAESKLVCREIADHVEFF